MGVASVREDRRNFFMFLFGQFNFFIILKPIIENDRRRTPACISL